jgi:PKHD-type hydroxylase
MSNINMVNYYWFEKAFSEEEIELIEEISKKYENKSATTFGDSGSYRTSDIKWLDESDETRWIYDRFKEAIAVANEEQFEFTLYTAESLQYTEYDSEKEGHYNWHIDIGEGEYAGRKLSVVLLLNDDYEGGELEIWERGFVPKGKGNLFIFPSYLLHRVTPVTEGIRKSLVLWTSGPTFK